jgi:hypothetical protein
MRHAPYADGAANDIYDLLFCDDAVAALAQDTTQDARVRTLACNWLSAHGQHVTPAELLGVVVEVALAPATRCRDRGQVMFGAPWAACSSISACALR